MSNLNIHSHANLNANLAAGAANAQNADATADTTDAATVAAQQQQYSDSVSTAQTPPTPHGGKNAYVANTSRPVLPQPPEGGGGVRDAKGENSAGTQSAGTQTVGQQGQDANPTMVQGQQGRQQQQGEGEGGQGGQGDGGGQGQQGQGEAPSFTQMFTQLQTMIAQGQSPTPLTEEQLNAALNQEPIPKGQAQQAGQQAGQSNIGAALQSLLNWTKCPLAINVRDCYTSTHFK